MYTKTSIHVFLHTELCSIRSWLLCTSLRQLLTVVMLYTSIKILIPVFIVVFRRGFLARLWAVAYVYQWIAVLHHWMWELLLSHRRQACCHMATDQNWRRCLNRSKIIRARKQKGYTLPGTRYQAPGTAVYDGEHNGYGRHRHVYIYQCLHQYDTDSCSSATVRTQEYQNLNLDRYQHRLHQEQTRSSGAARKNPHITAQMRLPMHIYDQYT